MYLCLYLYLSIYLSIYLSVYMYISQEGEREEGAAQHPGRGNVAMSSYEMLLSTSFGRRDAWCDSPAIVNARAGECCRRETEGRQLRREGKDGIPTNAWRKREPCLGLSV